MAKVRAVVLVCDSCGDIKGIDTQPIDALGVEIKGLAYHHHIGGQGWRDLYICLDCVEGVKLDDILENLIEKERDKR